MCSQSQQGSWFDVSSPGIAFAWANSRFRVELSIPCGNPCGAYRRNRKEKVLTIKMLAFWDVCFCMVNPIVFEHRVTFSDRGKGFACVHNTDECFRREH